MLIKEVDLKSILFKLKSAEQWVDRTDPSVIDPLTQAIEEIETMFVQELKPGDKKYYNSRHKAIVEVVNIDLVGDRVLVKVISGKLDAQEPWILGNPGLYSFSPIELSKWDTVK